jgi:hypothetical protein
MIPFKPLTATLAILLTLAVGALIIASGRAQDLRAKLARERQVVADLKDRVAASESARQAEREQCAADFAGEVMRAKVEAERAAKSATAIAALTKNCAFDRGQPAVNRALRDVLGEGK